jgi:hypothetical protein
VFTNSKTAVCTHFRLPALPLNIPPRVALKGFSGAVIAVLDGADHRVRALILTFGTKKRRIVLIVVSWSQSVFQRLMLLDYQIEQDLASGVVFFNVCGWAKW